MTWREKTDRALGKAVAAFGEGVTYESVSGDPYELEAIFSERYEAVDPETGASVTTEQPNLGVRLSQVEAPPAQHDLVTLADGRRFEVVEVQLDSGGGARLLLHEAPEPEPDP